MKTNSEETKRRLLAAALALLVLVALVAAIARARPTSTAAQAKPVLAVVRLPGGGQRTVLLQPHATTQTSPGGQTQLVSAVGANGQPVLVSQPVGGGDR
jgi:hypothetical protein